MALWYYGNDGQRIGPVEENDFRAMIAQGRIGTQTPVWREGMVDWQPLGQLPELSSHYAPPAHYDPGYAQNMARSSGQAVASLVCGIIGLITCFPLLGIPAVICGHMALNQIENAQVPTTGRGMAIAGLIMGYIQILLILTLIVGITIAIRKAS